MTVHFFPSDQFASWGRVIREPHLVARPRFTDEIGSLLSTFTPGPDGRRPVFGTDDRFADDPLWQDDLLFFEYFDGDTGEGLGATHQTGWTALVAHLLCRRRLGDPSRHPPR